MLPKLWVQGVGIWPQWEGPTLEADGGLAGGNPTLWLLPCPACALCWWEIPLVCLMGCCWLPDIIAGCQLVAGSSPNPM